MNNSKAVWERIEALEKDFEAMKRVIASIIIVMREKGIVEEAVEAKEIIKEDGYGGNIKD